MMCTRRSKKMVQLQTADRLNQVIKFGTIEDGEDDNGMQTKVFIQIGKPTLCGQWSLSTNQMIQMAGLNQTQNMIVVVHHRNSWSGITDAELGGQPYRVSNINQDPYRNPTAYDLITLTKVGDANG